MAGPMSGYPEHNFPAFEDACASLRKKMYILSPHEVEHGERPEDRGKLSYEEYLREDFKLLTECQGIILLPGWTKSKGAMAEFHYAVAAGMEIRAYRNGRTIRMDTP